MPDLQRHSCLINTEGVVFGPLRYIAMYHPGEQQAAVIPVPFKIMFEAIHVQQNSGKSSNKSRHIVLESILTF